MGVLITVTVGLMIWIILWAEGIKSFDGFLITIALALLAVVGRAAIGLIPGNREDPDA